MNASNRVTRILVPVLLICGVFLLCLLADNERAVYNGKIYSDLEKALSAAVANTDTPRLCDQVVQLMSDDIRYQGEIPLGVLLNFNGQFGAAGPMFTYMISGTEHTDPITIFPQIKNGKQYLFLPSLADYSRIDLHLPAGAVITDQDSGKQITARSGEIDLTKLFGDMSDPGATFPIRVEFNRDRFSFSQEVILIKSADIDSLFVELSDPEIPDMVDWLNHDKANRPEGGQALMLDESGQTVRYAGDLRSFHARGNTALGDGSLKPGYAIKLEKKAILAGETKARSWCLISNPLDYRDNTSYASFIGFTLYQRMNSGFGDDYAVQFKPVDLYINGEYRGMYLLADKINADRIPVDESEYSIEEDTVFTKIKAEIDPEDPAIKAGITKYLFATESELEAGGEGGYILELAGYPPNEASFVTSRGVGVLLDEPSAATREQVQRIAIFYQEFEDALFAENGINSQGKTIDDYIDIPSWAKAYLLKAYMLDQDFLWGSWYFYIDADEDGLQGKMKCAAAWDFDASDAVLTGGGDYLLDENLHKTSGRPYRKEFLRNEAFYAELQHQNADKVYLNGTKSFSDLLQDMVRDDGPLDRYFAKTDHAMRMNAVLWDDCTWDEDVVSRVRKSLSKRNDVWNRYWSEN